jgi:nardilysin
MSHLQVDLSWSLPSLLSQNRVKPLHYMSWIIGHEGGGSLISYLRRKVWALALTAGNDGDRFEYNSTFSVFTITVTLTKEGYQNLDHVLGAVFR